MSAKYLMCEDHAFVPVDTGYLIYDSSNSKVIYLNKSAAAILKLCDGILTIAEIAVEVGKQFAVSKPLESDVRECLRTLLDAGLVRPIKLGKKTRSA